ncbi:MAG: hypothetical protein WC836_20675, partial [Desulfobacula sp.]
MLINALYVEKYSDRLAGHILNTAYLIYVAFLCYRTGSFYSTLIFMLFLLPLFPSVFSGKKEKVFYILFALIIFCIFSLGQELPFLNAAPEKMINLGYYRFPYLFSMFLFSGSSILVLSADKNRVNRLLIQSEKEKIRVEENAKKAMKIKDEFLANMS